MKVVGYLRVSAERQAGEGLGLDVQEQAIRTWAKAEGHWVTRYYQDEEISGAKDLDSRAGLGDALHAVRTGQTAGVVVYRLDRLARDLILQEQLLGELRRLGGEVFTTSATEAGDLTDDPDDPARRLIRQVLAAVDDYERGVIALRLRNGRRRKAARGGYAYGSPAYGMRAEAGALVPISDEQLTILRMRELRSGGASLRSIAATLQNEGRRPKRGGAWHAMTIARVLQRT